MTPVTTTEPLPALRLMAGSQRLAEVLVRLLSKANLEKKQPIIRLTADDLAEAYAALCEAGCLQR